MRRWVFVILVLTGVLVAASVAGATTVYFYDHARSDRLADGVVIAGVDVSGLKRDVAAVRVRRALLPRLQAPFELTFRGRRFVIRPTHAGLSVDVDGMVARALTASRDGNVLDRFLREVRDRPLNLRVPLRAGYSRASIEAFSRWVGRRLKEPASSASVVPTATSISIVPSHAGLAVRTDVLARELEQRILDPGADRTLTVPTRRVRPGVTTAGLARKYPSYILVDRESFQLRLFRGLRLYKTYRIAVGRAGLETPAGLYRIYDRQVNPSWHVPDSAWAGSLAGQVIPPGPDDPIKARWLGFYNGSGIHGTDDLSSIGTAASHGCIRMSIPDVEELYGLVPYGTPIYVA
jgi:lipoprotein-anchoring transpeptidase ErfK/SrfK